MKILNIQPFLKSYGLYPVAGGKDKAAAEIVVAAVRAGHEIFVLPLPWSGKKVVSEKVFDRMPFLIDHETIRGEVLPTVFVPSGRRLVRESFRAILSNGGWRRPYATIESVTAFLMAEERQAVENALREVDIDLVHNHQSSSDAPRLLREAGFRGPLVLTNHSAVLSPYLSEYDQVVFVSDYQRSHALRNQPELAGRSRVIHYYVTSEYCGTLSPRVSDEIVFIGVLDSPRKGLPLILQTLAANEDLHRYKLHVIGEGEMLAEHRLFTTKHGLNVVFHGRVSHARNAEIMARAGLYLMPSRGEGMALTYIEALCMGLPLIGYPPNLNELEEILGEKVGFAFDPETEDTTRLHDLIVEAMDESGPFPPESRTVFAEEARRLFSQARFRDNYIRLYQEIEARARANRV